MNDIVTIVGENTVIKGSLQGDEDLTIFGKVEGTIHLSRTLILESSGIVVADIEVQDAIISGVVVGNITASNSVQITEEGRMVGDLSAPRVIIVDGASFKGHVDMGDLEAPVGEGLPVAPRSATRGSRIATASDRSAMPARRPMPSKPAAKAEPPAKPAAAKPAPSKPAPSKPAPSRPKVPVAPPAKAPAAKGRRKPPRPPSVPKGKRKVKRRR
jgi:cytoskeletal protein CcmA (bactofilin family)